LAFVSDVKYASFDVNELEGVSVNKGARVKVLGKSNSDLMSAVEVDNVEDGNDREIRSATSVDERGEVDEISSVSVNDVSNDNKVAVGIILDLDDACAVV
jgi:hypothetical protein